VAVSGRYYFEGMKRVPTTIPENWKPVLTLKSNTGLRNFIPMCY